MQGRRMSTQRPGLAGRTIPVLIGVVVTLVLTTGAVLWPENDYLFKIYQNIQVFGRVYKEVSVNYVDVVDPQKFMQAGIDGMLGTLDPYTVYIGKEEGDEVDLMTTGKYGGIGVTIGIRDGSVQVMSVMDGYSAQRAGIMPGDRLMKIDSVSVVNKNSDEVRALTRGEPGTEVQVLIEREGEKEPLQFILVREEIQVKNVTFAGYVAEGIGYIRLERFSRKAGEEVRQALKDLKASGDLKGLVLDLRGNPGGLLDAAVEVVSKFVAKGSPVVTTKGRRSEADKKYHSAEEPLVPALPLVVLTDRGSASASEIVGGSLQDLDRAVIVGGRTFGKGLVQTIVPLEYGAQLKITTARYYTPSGRCIQEIDYTHRDKSGVFESMPDSMKREYKTSNGRKVREGGGIMPDSVVTLADPGPMVRELHRHALFFRFVNHYAGEHKGEEITAVNDKVLEAFRQYLQEQKFDYQEEGEVKVTELQKLGEQYHYGKQVDEQLRQLGEMLQKERQRGFDRFKDHISRELAIEFMNRAKGERGRIEASLKEDDQLKAAVGIVKNPKLYARKLSS
jgi:carboxyl-terminal processing protease